MGASSASLVISGVGGERISGLIVAVGGVVGTGSVEAGVGEAGISLMLSTVKAVCGGGKVGDAIGALVIVDATAICDGSTAASAADSGLQPSSISVGAMRNTSNRPTPRIGLTRRQNTCLFCMTLEHSDGVR